MATKVSKSYYTEKYIKKFGNKFDYSNFEYVNAVTPSLVICPIHGPFYITPHKHLMSQHGCRKCGAKARWNRDRVTTDDFIKRAKAIHGDLFDYSNTKLVGMENKVIITCKRHGDFNQNAANHLIGNGCPMCRNLKTSDEFISDCRKIHGSKYDYRLTDYRHNRGKVKIVCKKHGEFEKVAGHHLEGKGCPKCRASKGEKKIGEWLSEHNTEFVGNKSFSDCINPKSGHKLRFDFYLPHKNILIEYDGKQHFEFVENWQQDRRKFMDGLEKDRIKTEYAKNKNIRLIRIPYTKYKKIENILEKELDFL